MKKKEIKKVSIDTPQVELKRTIEREHTEKPEEEESEEELNDFLNRDIISNRFNKE